VKTDPKSRLFYPLAEELRKAGKLDEAEQVLRTGLVVHSTYLSAWVSLGRVLRDQQKHADAVEPFSKAMQLDPGNVVAARLLADTYLSLGEKVEAIKKYKLVHALLPSDEELEGVIEQLQKELNEPAPFIEPVQEESWEEAEAQAIATGDAEPMLAAHSESPFEEPSPDYSAAALVIEEPEGFSIEAAPIVAEVPAPVEDVIPQFEPEPEPEPLAVLPEPIADEADVFAPLATTELPFPEAETPVVEQEDVVITEAPREELVVAAVAAPAPADSSRDPRVDRLEEWLARVSRREVGRV